MPRATGRLIPLKLRFVAVDDVEDINPRAERWILGRLPHNLLNFWIKSQAEFHLFV